jgi:hypothetical protein
MLTSREIEAFFYQKKVKLWDTERLDYGTLGWKLMDKLIMKGSCDYGQFSAG